MTDLQTSIKELTMRANPPGVDEPDPWLDQSMAANGHHQTHGEPVKTD